VGSSLPAPPEDDTAWPPLATSALGDDPEDDYEDEDDGESLYVEVDRPTGRRYWPTRTLAAATPATPQRWAQPLAEWEERLCRDLDRVRWIGQIDLSESDYLELCAVTQAEARARYGNRIKIRPASVPPAVFVVGMVFTARYGQTESDEFWGPYLRRVWGVEYSPSLQGKCRARFLGAIRELERRYNRLYFPRLREGDVVHPVYRHALLPRYVQADFTDWVRNKWSEILRLADEPTLLMPALLRDPNFKYLPKRLQQFIQSPNSRDAAADLIADMARAIGLYVKQGRSAAEISGLLADTPLKQELWKTIVEGFEGAERRRTAAARTRVDWVWELDDGTMHLRAQNIVIPAGSDLEGEPHRLVWLNTPQEDPSRADLEVYVNAWRMSSGERLVREAIVEPPATVRPGAMLVLLTDMDEQAWQTEVPDLPTEPVIFFRPALQGAKGVLTPERNVGIGDWLICATQPLRMLDADNAPIEPSQILRPPDHLDSRYHWAARVHLTLSAAFHAATGCMDSDPLLQLDRNNREPFVMPLLQGESPVGELAPLFCNTFADTAITLTFDEQTLELARQLTVLLEDQNGRLWSGTLHDLLEQTGAGDGQTAHLAKLLPSRAGAYTLDILDSLQSLLPEPITFAVVPGLRVTIPERHPLYSPEQPFAVVLHGLAETQIVPRANVAVKSTGEGALRVSWSDLRDNPRLLLRFDGAGAAGSTEIPLEWTPPRVAAWLEPSPARSLLTLEEFEKATLHVVAEGTGVREFVLDAGKEGTRTHHLQRGRARIEVGRDQLKSMARQVSRMAITVRIGSAAWKLCEVRKLPNLAGLRLSLDEARGKLSLRTGLKQREPGSCRFLAVSLSNPFARPRELARTESLEPTHTLSITLPPSLSTILPARLPPDSYQLRIELDGRELPIGGTASHFTVREQGATRKPELPPVQDGALVDAIRAALHSGRPIDPDLASDFVLLWAELAESGEVQLTPELLLLLAAVPADVLLEHFQVQHLRPLWHVLAALREVQDQKQWRKAHGLLPAWILLPYALIFRVPDYGHEWTVYPLVAAKGGRTGKGYGMWPVAGRENTGVLVQWEHKEQKMVLVQAGLPADKPPRWDTLPMKEVGNLYYCPACGRLVGEKGMDSAEVQKAHRHSMPNAALRAINPEVIPHPAAVQASEPFLLERHGERRGKPLLNVYAEFDVQFPDAQSCLPEPETVPPLLSARHERLLENLIHAIINYGNSVDASSPLAAAARLLLHWREQGIGNGKARISQMAQAAFALSMLLRTAAYDPPRYRGLLAEAALMLETVRDLLDELNRNAPEHLAWGMTWAQLLMLHSPNSQAR